MSLKRKADSSHETDSSHGQSKKQKVSFNPSVEVRYANEFDEKGLELVRAEVRRALETRDTGSSDYYDEIKQLFNTKPNSGDAASTKLLKKYLVALMSRVSSLGKNHSGLVRAILYSQWLARDEGYVEMYTRFLGALMSAQNCYASLVLRMLVDNLKTLSSATSRPRNVEPRPRATLYARVHGVIKYLLNLIPSASGTLSSILSSSYPYDSDPTRTHVTFINSLLELADYAPELKGDILTLITERLVKIDVQIQDELDALEDEDEDDFLADILRKQTEVENYTAEEQEDDSDDSDDESVSSEDTVEPETQKIKELKESIAKMDATIDILFAHYHPIFARGSYADIDDAFRHLQSHFCNIVLPTYRSRHTQFLLFHFAQASPDLVERFASTCVSQSFSPSQPSILRLAAASYLASFIARGAHVPASVARDVFQIFGGHLESILVAHEHNCTGPDVTRFGGYYAISQALLYMFCFRWRDLLQNSVDFTADDADEILLNNNGRELRWMPGIKDMLSKNIYSKFNPLKICSPAIVTQFARIAHHLRFLYVFPLLETNKRVRLTTTHRSGGTFGPPERETALSSKNGDSAWQLDAYFPFDPYRLPKSKRWLEGDYVEWKGVPGLDDDNGQLDDEESDEEETPEHPDGYASESPGAALPREDECFAQVVSLSSASP